MSRELETVLFEIGGTSSLNALWSTVLRFYHRMGFEAVSYVLFDRGRMDEAVAVFVQGFPQALVNAYVEMGYGKDDPTLRHVMETGRPATPNQVEALGYRTQGEVQHRERMRALGAGNELCFPLFGPNGRDGYGVLGRPARPDPPDPADIVMLHMVGQAAHLRAFALQRKANNGTHGLSEREVEILRWVAQGKSNAVIADILGLSTGTVDTYLRRVFEKLGVADRTTAAVMGVSLGLIRA